MIIPLDEEESLVIPTAGKTWFQTQRIALALSGFLSELERELKLQPKEITVCKELKNKWFPAIKTGGNKKKNKLGDRDGTDKDTEKDTN